MTATSSTVRSGAEAFRATHPTTMNTNEPEHAGETRRPWPDPTRDQLASPQFEAIWQCIKRWDINVPDAYAGYCGATGNHVRAILDALNAVHGDVPFGVQGTPDAPPAPTPPADAQEPTCLPFAVTDERVQRLHILLDAAVKERNELRDKVAALAQERDDLLELNRLLENTPSERLLAALTDVSRLTEELDRLTAERDALKAMLAPSFSSDPNAYPKAIATLTAERDRYHAALLGVANHVYITGQSCWCNAWEEHPEHYRPDQHHAYCTVALALSGAQGAPDAALAPTQKEEA